MKKGKMPDFGDKVPIDFGYSSHGQWSTLKEIRSIEKEKGNPFPRVGYPDDSRVIWICPTRRLAFRYSASADDWEKYSDKSQVLTKEEERALTDIVPIKIKRSDVIIWEDPDEGYLLLRKVKKR